MKFIYRITGATILSVAAMLTACQDPDYATPNTTTTPTNLSANFLLANASVDAASLDLFLNNVKRGESVAVKGTQAVYSNIPLSSNGGLSNGNVSIRAKATSNAIGGVLGSNDLIYRSTNNGTNNLAAADSAYYTVFVLDSVTRPKPLRTFNSKNFGDTTFFNPATGTQISVVERAALSSVQKARLVPIGTVPLGVSDPGGLRFLIINDQLPLPSTQRFPKPSATQAAIRFFNLSPDAPSVTARYNTTSITQAVNSFPMRQSGTYNPAVGSRSTTLNFQLINQGTYDLTARIGSGPTEIARSNGQVFAPGGVYTVFMSGKFSPVNTLTFTVIRHK